MVSVQDLFKSAVHYGHRKSKWNPKMKKYIFAEKDGVHIINIEKTKDKLEEACTFLKTASSSGKNILFVGTKPQVSSLMKKLAEDIKCSYINKKWPAGLLTNWEVFGHRIKEMKELEEQLQSGELQEKYTKKELSKFKKDLTKLQDMLGGVREMEKLPDILFVVDPYKEQLAIKEAQTIGVPVVAIVDTNADPDGIQFVIPANDDAMRSLDMVLSCVRDACVASAKPKKSTVKKMNVEEKAEEKAAE